MKVLDITERLKTQEQPVMKMFSQEFLINDDAVTLLSVMELMEGDVGMLEIKDAAILIFGEDGFRRLAELKLNLENFALVVEVAMSMVTGETEGEEMNPTTTFSTTGIS